MKNSNTTNSIKLRIIGSICLLSIVITCSAFSLLKVCVVGGGNGFVMQADSCSVVRDENGACLSCTGSIGGFLSAGCNTCVSAVNVCGPAIPPTVCTTTPVIYSCTLVSINSDEACFCVASPTPIWVGAPSTAANPC